MALLIDHGLRRFTRIFPAVADRRYRVQSVKIGTEGMERRGTRATWTGRPKSRASGSERVKSAVPAKHCPS